MIDRMHSLPLTRQCQLLNLNRSAVYYQPIGVSDEDLQLMWRIDEMHLKRPFYGSRRIRDWLQDEDLPMNRKRVKRLMQQMGIAALYPKANSNRLGIGNYFRFYNRERRHQSLKRQTPDQAYEGNVIWPVGA